MIIPIASDHAGFEAKQYAKKVLEKLGHTAIDYGTHDDSSVDYPDYAKPVATSVDKGEHELGILVCGSGQGMCMSANKFGNVRASLVWDRELASLTRKHNNSNVLCLPGRFLTEKNIEDIVTDWLATEFEGGRHENRVQKLHNITKE